MEASAPTADVEFISGHWDAMKPLGITFVGENSDLDTKADWERIHDYLYDNFDPEVFLRTEPFLVLGYDKDSTGPSRLPCSIGGYIPIWRSGGDIDDFWPLFGDSGDLGGADLSDEALSSHQDINVIQGPTVDQMRRLATTVFPECEALTWIANGELIVELPKTDEEAYFQKLIGFGPFNGLSVVAQFRNVPLFCDRRPGTSLKNDTMAKRFLKPDEVRLYDRLIIDDSATGSKQYLTSLGRRVKIARRRDDSDDDKSGTATYITGVQSIYATDCPTIGARTPRINLGDCEGVLLRQNRVGKAEEVEKEETIFKQGEISGMMHFGNTSNDPGAARQFLVYVDSFDPLMEEGLEFLRAQAGEDVMNEESGNKDGDHDKADGDGGGDGDCNVEETGEKSAAKRPREDDDQEERLAKRSRPIMRCPCYRRMKGKGPL